MLKTNSLIVSLSVSQWVARKHDKTITNEVKTNHNAADDAGRYNKLLVSKQHTDPINQVVGRARTFHYENTLSWGDNNERLLPTKNYFSYVTEMSKFKSEFEQAVALFFKNYDDVIAEAKVRLNGMFKESDYPSKVEIQNKFGFKTSFMPVPDNDVRVELQNEEVDKLRESIELEINNRITGAVNDIWARIKDTIGKMRDKLADTDAIFRDSLFENISDLAKLLPRLNVTNDINIANVCNDIQGLISDPNAIRNNKQLRQNKAEEAEQILAKFSQFFQ